MKELESVLSHGVIALLGTRPGMTGPGGSSQHGHCLSSALTATNLYTR